MLIEEKKKTVSMHPTTFLVFFLCLIGLSVSATFLIVRANYQSQLDDKNKEMQTVQKNSQALADQNTESRNSLQKLQDEYGKLGLQYKDLESRLNAAEQKNAQADIDQLKIKTAFVDNGPFMKRMEPRAMGRANVIKKRSCHITIILSEE